jgi:S-adenosylmethionine:tRNA ribosyltransferase-isomerase
MINIKDYTYQLSEERIAKFPLAQRDDSKLLIYKEGRIEHQVFKNLAEHLPEGALLVFNNTKVIPARLIFTKDTGATIEIFLLSPTQPSTLLQQVMQTQEDCEWLCAVGNVKRWTANTILQASVGSTTIEARLIDREEGRVAFKWSGRSTFVELIEQLGKVPLPPYLKREAVESDKARYQTVYSQHEGAVAAPTAGLHFTPEVFTQLATKHIKNEYVTLHVSAGTFQPVKTTDALAHTMHSEQIVVRKQTLERLLETHTAVVAVGTTSMRTLESIYWLGVKIMNDSNAMLQVLQDEPYKRYEYLPTKKQALEALILYLQNESKNELVASTAMYIHRPYSFRLCDALITNFHQPNSTLLLLVAAFVGDDWKKIYEQAMDNDYRFLSYGDSSLLFSK